VKRSATGDPKARVCARSAGRRRRRRDACGVACHAFACHPGAWAGGLGHGRRHHSRWPRPTHEQTVLMARRLRTEHGAPRAWAGAMARATCPCSTLACSPQRPSANGRPPLVVTGGWADAQLGSRLSGDELGEANGLWRSLKGIGGRLLYGVALALRQPNATAMLPLELRGRSRQYTAIADD